MWTTTFSKIPKANKNLRFLIALWHNLVVSMKVSDVQTCGGEHTDSKINVYYYSYLNTKLVGCDSIFSFCFFRQRGKNQEKNLYTES